MSVSSSQPAAPSLLLSLPTELREHIWSLYLKPADRLVRSAELEEQGLLGGVYRFEFALWRVNKQLYSEAKGVWRRENVVVKIATPWSTTVHHVSFDGLVPIVCAQKQAAQFQGEHALVTITAPTDEEPPDHAMVVLLDDLPLFTQNWHYSELRYPDLKHQLKATFTLRAPAHKALQEKILLPFGQVKGLHSIDAPGFSAQVKQELQRRMATPAPTLRECCDAATQLLAQGDGALAAGNPTAALDTYARAFKAIHILIEGRTRRILVDTFFHSTIPDGPYAGQTGITVRVTLRLRLVARTMAAHLALGAWADAAFWGTRSIRSIQDAMGTDVEDLLSAFLGDADTGLIYVRTAVALWKMECSGTAWTNEGEGEGYTRLGSAELWASGVRYLRQVDKEPVRRELEGYGLGKEILRLFSPA